MKNLIYTFAFTSLAWLTTSCGDDNAPLPSDHANVVGVQTENISKTLTGQWKKCVVTQTIYSNGKKTTQTLSTQTGDFRFDTPSNSFVDFMVYNFPANGTFEVRRYGGRFDFYLRATNQHVNLMLKELSPTKAVFSRYEMSHTDYFIVISHTLTK